MAVTSGFYNSVDGDRIYDAEDFGGVFDSIIGDGIIRGFGGEFKVSVNSGLSLKSAAGRAWYNSHWVHNDDDYVFTAPAADVALGRIDSVILRVNSATSVRQASIIMRQGTAATNPVPPAVTNTATLSEVVLADIDRPANSTSITSSRITNRVGTVNTPYATNRLLEPSFDPPMQHRNIFRGKYLGSSVTTTQKARIQDGSFDDLYVGDYWTMGGFNWRIADIDYYWGKTGLTPSGEAHNKHHLLIMPDTHLRFGKLNEASSKANSGAYYGMDARPTHLGAMLTTVLGLFGTGSVITYETYVTTGIFSGLPGGSNLILGRLDLPSSVMFFGHDMWNPRAFGGTTPPQLYSLESTQLSLFRLAPQFIKSANTTNTLEAKTTWTRDIFNSVHAAVVGSYGQNTFVPTSGSYGFRPYFLLGE